MKIEIEIDDALLGERYTTDINNVYELLFQRTIAESYMSLVKHLSKNKRDSENKAIDEAIEEVLRDEIRVLKLLQHNCAITIGGVTHITTSKELNLNPLTN